MLSLDLIELADLVTPDTIVASILKQNPDMPVPVPIEELAKLAGISSIQALTSDSFEGALVANDEKSNGAIFYSTRGPITRQRFTIGHELGHFLLPWHRQEKFQCSTKDMTASGSPADWEVQANQFSAGLLLPKPQLKRRMKQLGSPDLEHIERLADVRL